MSNIRVFEKNRIDLSFKTAVTITVTDLIATSTGQDFVNAMRNRRNVDGWATTNSTDAALTQLDIDMGDPFDITQIMLIKHNLKAYTLQFFNGITYVDFSTPILETVNDKETTVHRFDAVKVSLFRLIIQGTQIVDADKFISQFIMTSLVGEFVSQPDINPARLTRSRKVTKLISGRGRLSRRQGALECDWVFQAHVIQADQDLLTDIFDSIEGRLVSLTGEDDSQLRVKGVGFRNEDYFLMAAENDQETGYLDGYFSRGIPVTLKLFEVR